MAQAGPIRLRDAETGVVFQLAPEPSTGLTRGDMTEEELDELDRALEGVDWRAHVTGTDREAIRRGSADAEAGRMLTVDEMRERSERRFPFLKSR